MPRDLRLLPCADAEIGVQSGGHSIIFFLDAIPGRVKLLAFWTRPLGTQQRRASLEGGFIEVHLPDPLLDEEPISPCSHSPPSGQTLGCSSLSFCDWCLSQGIEVCDPLFGSLVSKFPGYLHLVSGFLESMLVGGDVYHVAGLRV